MKLKLSCADFSFPLLSHDAALEVIALHALEYVWIDLEHYNEVGVLSETIQLGAHLTAAVKSVGR